MDRQQSDSEFKKGVLHDVVVNIMKEKRKIEQVDYPGNEDVEKALIENERGEIYKLGTGPHHVTQVNSASKPPFVDWILVKIQNVHDYYMEHGKAHNWNAIQSFTCVKPPFPRILFSYDHEFVHPETRKFTTRHVNVGVSALKLKDFFAKALEDKVVLGESIHQLHTLDPDSVVEEWISVDGIRLPGSWYVFIDAKGQVLTDEEHQLGWIWLRDPRDTKKLQEKAEWAEEFESAVSRHGSIALAAIQFMNCKNVEVLENGPTRQQKRQAQREGKQPETTYKTLLIHPMGRRKRFAIPKGVETIYGVSLHIVRGHFKDYREGGGLGKFHTRGMWWWSPQVRGSSERGRVEKDYEVFAEKEKANVEG